jgi:hypothetical protein
MAYSGTALLFTSLLIQYILTRWNICWLNIYLHCSLFYVNPYLTRTIVREGRFQCVRHTALCFAVLPTKRFATASDVFHFSHKLLMSFLYTQPKTVWWSWIKVKLKFYSVACYYCIQIRCIFHMFLHLYQTTVLFPEIFVHLRDKTLILRMRIYLPIHLWFI